ncbi:MAG: prepilin-type N-terminal cleavage/methylation domain-containing protein [Planctomycetales bacterium]|nr:prepilin-type N-terminal cleavage/methylation domain-containing protein [Planctomycetales bacterium]
MARFGTARRGFTLVEMLVVLAIIGILTAILVPTLGVVMRSVRQTSARVEMKNMEAAIEKYKNDVGTYPIDFQVASLIFPHVRAVSNRAVGTEALYASMMVDPLPNPYFQTNPTEPEFRTFQTMSPHEAIVFLLSELSENKEYPFGYRYDGTNWQLIDFTWNGSTWSLSGTKRAYFAFDQKRLRDNDNDGWLEFVPSGFDMPYVYYDARTYVNAPGIASLQMDFDTGAGPGLTGYTSGGTIVPYAASPTEFINPKSYQLICAGVDNYFGSGAVVRTYPAGGNFTDGDNDNLANFAESRLDQQLAQ